MAKFRYTVTHYSFKEPRAIGEYEYLRLKQQLQNDSTFSLIDPNETMTENFSSLLKVLIGAGISAVLLPVFWIATESNSKISSNAFFVIVFVIITLWTICPFDESD